MRQTFWQSQRLAGLAAEIDRLAAQDLDRLADPVLAEEVLELRRLADRLDGQWLRRLATVDGRGAAGTAKAVCAGAVSPAHAQVLAQGTKDLPTHVTAEAEPLLLEAARRLDPTRLRRAVDHLVLIADPEGADAQGRTPSSAPRVVLAPTFDGMVAVDGLLEPEGGQILLSALEPLARPADAGDTRTGSQRNADALTELARRALEGGQLPKTRGGRPQLAVILDLDSLLHPGRGGLGGEAGRAGPLTPRPAGGWPATPRSPGPWSAASRRSCCQGPLRATPAAT